MTRNSHRALMLTLVAVGLLLFLFKSLILEIPISGKVPARLSGGANLEQEEVFSVFLMVPIGLLVVVFLRNVIGMQLFGSFIPVLIAISLLEVDSIWGAAFFVIASMFGLFAGICLERLKILFVPTLGAAMVVTVCAVFLGHVFFRQTAFFSSISLLPLLVVLLVVERMLFVWEEQGVRDAVRQAAGTVLAAMFVFFVIRGSIAQYLFLTFPELLLIIFAAMLFLGRYTGFRLLEFKRFRAFLRDEV